jgi:threonine dehydrogenase-like Zn-dependent dehydrogenase
VPEGLRDEQVSFLSGAAPTGYMGADFKGLTVRTAQQYGQKYLPRLLEHAARRELDPSYLATHRFCLEEAPRGYEMFEKKEEGCVRAGFVLLDRRPAPIEVELRR